jgi:hypothetical protein
VVFLFDVVRKCRTIFAQDISAAALSLRLWNRIYVGEIHSAEVVFHERASVHKRRVCW